MGASKSKSSEEMSVKKRRERLATELAIFVYRLEQFEKKRFGRSPHVLQPSFQNALAREGFNFARTSREYRYSKHLFSKARNDPQIWLKQIGLSEIQETADEHLFDTPLKAVYPKTSHALLAVFAEKEDTAMSAGSTTDGESEANKHHFMEAAK